MTRKLRLLHIGNGSAYKIKAIIDGMVLRGHENHMVPIPPVNEAFEGVTWHALPRSPFPAQAKVLHRMVQIRRLVRKLRPDVVHAHNAWGPGWYGAAAGHHPFVIHGYGSDLLPEQYAGRSALQRRMTSWACRTADQIVVTGQHMVGASSHLGVEPGRITVMPRGVDLKRYKPGLDVSSLRKQLQLTDARPIVFSPRYQADESLYNLDVVVEAFAQVRLQFPDAVCLQMCSPNAHRGMQALRALAERHGLADSYRLIPSVDNVSMPLYFNLAHVAISVPSSDGFPVTVLEAAACACPLIVSDLPYCKEWFTPRENGLVIPARDAKALADAIVELWLSPALRQRLGQAGRRLVAARADHDRCMDGLEALYLTLLERQSRHRNEAR
jgi:glycosyltransferase involved in cell wall biosynthesis